jgi:hypothetical protein
MKNLKRIEKCSDVSEPMSALSSLRRDVEAGKRVALISKLKTVGTILNYGGL